MAKVTTKLQLTLPKAIAKQYGIQPGDEVQFQPAGELIRLVPRNHSAPHLLSAQQRLDLFDEATVRQQAREGAYGTPAAEEERGWRREDLYDRACGHEYSGVSV